MGTEISFPGLGWTIHLNNVAFSLFGIDIYWYGLIISLGIVLCGFLGIRHCKANKFSPDLVCDILLVSLPSAIIGARLYYVIFRWSEYSGDLLKIFDTRSGGLALYGGVIGAYLGAYIMLRIRKIPYSTCADYCIVYVPLGQAIGRWGNFFNQEAFGTTTTLPWGMTSSRIQAYLRANCPELDSTMPVHPTFLYESICNLILFFILLKVRKNSKHPYETCCVYMIGYGTVRFFIEGLRTDSLYIGNTGLRTSQVLSALLVVIGLVYILIAHLKDFRRVGLPERLLVKDGNDGSSAVASEKTEAKKTVKSDENNNNNNNNKNNPKK